MLSCHLTRGGTQGAQDLGAKIATMGKKTHFFFSFQMVLVGKNMEQSSRILTNVEFFHAMFDYQRVSVSECLCIFATWPWIFYGNRMIKQWMEWDALFSDEPSSVSVNIDKCWESQFQSMLQWRASYLCCSRRSRRVSAFGHRPHQEISQCPIYT